MIDEKKVILLSDFVERSVGFGKKITHLHLAFRILFAEGLGQVSRRRIMSLAKCRGKDEDGAFHGDKGWVFDRY